MNSLAVTDQKVLRLELAERLWRREAQEQVHRDWCLPRRVEAVRPERVGGHERPGARPPQCRLAPTPPAHDRHEREGAPREGVRCDDVGDTQALGEVCAVAVVAVEELDDAGGLAECQRTVDGVGPVDGIDEPHAPVRSDRVRGARQGPVDDPPEALAAELVAEAATHGDTVRAGDGATLARMNNGIGRARESAWRATISDKTG